MLIEGKDNKKIKLLKSLESKKHRDEKKLFVVESIKLIKEAIKENIEIEFVLISDEVTDKMEILDLLELVKSKNIQYHKVARDLFKQTVPTVTTQGAVAVAKKRKFEQNTVFDLTNFVIFCDEIQDPGNLGTIIRTADAFGPIGIILSKKCVDMYNEKVVRSCAGALYRVPVINVEDSFECIELLKESGFKIISTVVNSDKSFDELENLGKICLVIGNEGNGVSKDIQNISDEKITIKMTGRTESLNASVAAAISIYEIRKKLL